MPMHRPPATYATCREFTSRGVRAYCVRGYHVVALIELDCETARRYHRDRGSPRSNSLSRRVASYCIALHYREFRKSSLYIIVLISLCGLSLSFRFLRSKRIEGFCLERELLRQKFITDCLIKKISPHFKALSEGNNLREK